MKLESAEFIFVKKPRVRFRPVGGREIEVGMDTFLSDDHLMKTVDKSIHKGDVTAEAKRIILQEKEDLKKNPLIPKENLAAALRDAGTKEHLREVEVIARRRLFSQRLTEAAKTKLGALMGKAQKFCEGLEV